MFRYASKIRPSTMAKPLSPLLKNNFFRGGHLLKSTTNSFSTQTTNFISDIKVYSSASFLSQQFNTSRVVVVADDLKDFQQLTADSNVGKILNLSDSKDLELLKKLADTLKPSADSAKTLEHHFPLGPEKTLTKVVLVAMPNAHSRHNTPSRSYALANAMKPYKGSDAVKILLLPKQTEFALAQTYAIGRQFPLLSLKADHVKAATEKSSPPQDVSIIIDFPQYDATTHEATVHEANIALENIRFAQQLVDTPPNLLHTDAYVGICRTVAARLGCEITIIQGKDLEAQGFGGLWGVGKAAEHLPALAILSYYPPDTSKHTSQDTNKTSSVCLVGKGLVYDTGGLSIKTPSTGMQGMKMDMAGSAAVLGAFATSVALKQLTRPLHALLCLAENAIGPCATRPDDIHTLLSGKTVEVINTDAEGRLVLSDGVYYAAKYLSPKVIIDIATLTGAQLVATGKKHAAIVTNNEKLEKVTVQAGKDTGDLTFPLLYCPEFFRAEFTSTVADMTNLTADRANAQSSCAGQFIANHIQEYLEDQQGQWLHIDMAGSAMDKDRATGYGVALLHEITKQLQ